jgi:excinuclease ABC subunit A
VEIVDRIQALPEGTRLWLLAPLVEARKGEHAKLFERLRKDGFSRIRLGNEIVELSQDINLDKKKKHDISVLVDRLIIKKDLGHRLTDSVELALRTSEGLLIVALLDEKQKIKEELFFSERFACDYCGLSFPDLTPQLFSFNSPQGACPKCGGLGADSFFDPLLVVPDPDMSINEGAVAPWYNLAGEYMSLLEDVANHYGLDPNAPFNTLPKGAVNVIMNGSGREEIRFTYEQNGRSHTYLRPFEGVLKILDRKWQETTSQSYRDVLSVYMSYRDCPYCHGERLKPEALAVKVAGKSISELTRLPVKDCLDFFNRLDLGQQKMDIGQRIIKEITERLSFLNDVGLGYLFLARSSGSLSGGESQRIRLATQIGSQLVGVTYILDEPSIGLHQRDNAKLLAALRRMRDNGNTVIVVEHDAETINEADYVVDLGPGAGEKGGHLVVAGTPEEIIKSPKSLTGKYLSGKKKVPVPKKRRAGRGSVMIKNARANNLKNLTVEFPLGVFTCVTGVSGSGKSSLVLETLYRVLAKNRYYSKSSVYESASGKTLVNKVIDIDQSPIGRTPRSNPATYIGLFSSIRDIFAQLPAARTRGYPPGRFSFNVRGGRCEKCRGDGILKIEMHFLPDVYVKCDTCGGRRYNRDTLEIKYNGASIADVLEMSVAEALTFFKNIPLIREKLETLYDVGLGYIRLGQSATTLSGGEAQRIKLSKELSRRSTGRTVYILDEPTTGLHFDDVKKLLEVLQKLVEQGNTVVVIEHNMDVIKTADHIIDLGPEGGDGGGQILATGSPEEIARTPGSHTGQFLKKILEADS